LVGGSGENSDLKNGFVKPFLDRRNFVRTSHNPKGEPVMRCRWQMKRGGEGAAVKIVNNYVVPDDFGHRKRTVGSNRTEATKRDSSIDTKVSIEVSSFYR
jgi:hypothetical protein